MIGRSLVVGCVGLFMVAPLLGQSGAAIEDLRQWKQQIRLTTTDEHELNAVNPGQLIEVLLQPQVFGAARGDLGDLRLIGSKGQAVPYALRTLESRRVRNAIEMVKIFNRVALPEGGEQMSLDLGDRPSEHNLISLDVSGTSFGRPVLIESSDDGKTWAELAKVEVVRLSRKGQSIDLRQFSYPISRVRYLRLTAGPDRIEKEGELLGATVYYNVDEPGRNSDYPVQIHAREPVRYQGEYASQWILSLGEKNVPISQLNIEIPQEEYSRPFILENYLPGNVPQVLYDTTIQHRRGDPQPVLRFSEVQVHRLRLTILDSRNEPLQVQRAVASGASRLLIFRVPSEGIKDLSLYLGNPTATNPNYDFASTLPTTLGKLPELGLQSRQENPVYVPPERIQPWTERYPWVLDLVLLLALVALVIVFLRLARTAIARHDGTPVEATA